MEAVSSHDYTKMHTSMESAEAELAVVVGDKAPAVSLVRSMHAQLEGSFGKWSVAESLERRVLKDLPQTKPYRSILLISRQALCKALENQDKYDEALQLRLEILEQAKKDDPNNQRGRVTRALRDLSQFYEDFQQYDQAFSVTEQGELLEQKKWQDRGITMISSHELVREAVLKASGYRFADAIALLDKVMAASPKHAWFYSERGLIYKRDYRNYPAAISDYTKAIELEEAQHPEVSGKGDDKVEGVGRGNTYFYYFRRAVAYAENNELAKALKDADMSLHLYDQNSLCYSRRGEIYSKMGKLELALADFSQATKFLKQEYPANPTEEASIYLLRGDAYRRAGKYKEALADYDRCVQKASGDPRGYIGQAAMYEQLSDHKKALADFAQAEKCLTQFAPKHRLINVMVNIPELKERMAQSLYEQRAKVYDSMRDKKLAEADRAKAKAQVVPI
jgi:tetratricopeptide (TPR) repeat protein